MTLTDDTIAALHVGGGALFALRRQMVAAPVIARAGQMREARQRLKKGRAVSE
ncbi:MAG: hypothetical protein WCS20_00205 [Alphaproteobacteria bacterium]|jgi:hypothetical protein